MWLGFALRNTWGSSLYPQYSQLLWWSTLMHVLFCFIHSAVYSVPLSIWTVLDSLIMLPLWQFSPSLLVFCLSFELFQLKDKSHGQIMNSLKFPLLFSTLFCLVFQQTLLDLIHFIFYLPIIVLYSQFPFMNATYVYYLLLSFHGWGDFLIQNCHFIFKNKTPNLWLKALFAWVGLVNCWVSSGWSLCQSLQVFSLSLASLLSAACFSSLLSNRTCGDGTVQNGGHWSHVAIGC